MKNKSIRLTVAAALMSVVGVVGAVPTHAATHPSVVSSRVATVTVPCASLPAPAPSGAAASRSVTTADTSSAATPAARKAVLPAVLAVLVPVIARCLIGALGGVAVNEIITLVHQGKTATAESRVYAAVGGCITSVVPPFLRPLAMSLRRPIATAVLWAVLKIWTVTHKAPVATPAQAAAR